MPQKSKIEQLRSNFYQPTKPSVYLPTLMTWFTIASILFPYFIEVITVIDFGTDIQLCWALLESEHRIWASISFYSLLIGPIMTYQAFLYKRLEVETKGYRKRYDRKSHLNSKQMTFWEASQLMSLTIFIKLVLLDLIYMIAIVFVKPVVAL